MKCLFVFLMSLIICFNTTCFGTISIMDEYASNLQDKISNQFEGIDLANVNIPNYLVDNAVYFKYFAILLLMILILLCIIKFFSNTSKYVQVKDRLINFNQNKYLLINILFSIVISCFIAFLPNCYLSCTSLIDENYILYWPKALIKFLCDIIFTVILIIPLVRYRHTLKLIELKSLSDAEYMVESRKELKKFLIIYLVFIIIGCGIKVLEFYI